MGDWEHTEKMQTSQKQATKQAKQFDFVKDSKCIARSSEKSRAEGRSTYQHGDSSEEVERDESLPSPRGALCGHAAGLWDLEAATAADLRIHREGGESSLVPRENWLFNTLQRWHLPQITKITCLCRRTLLKYTHLLQDTITHIIVFPTQNVT
jgi:hypothetical protein